MKSLKELRNVIDFHPNELGSRLKYFSKQNIDFDVYLPSIGKNLQRELCWTLEQKRELINSILIGRHIPHFAIISIIDPNDNKEEIFQVIDGKQRLSTMISFFNNEFTIVIDKQEYYMKDLPDDYQVAITHYDFRSYMVYEQHDKPITDIQKFNWFNFLNHAGTPQDINHIKNIEKEFL